MVDIDPLTGLPKELGVWDDIVKEGQEINVRIDKKRFGKEYTVITGLGDVDIKDLAKKLKHKFACGGTAKGGRIELQGNHLKEAGDVLISLGFAPETINVKRR